MYLPKLLSKLLVSFLAFMFLSTSVYSADELTQEERTEIAAKLAPIITMLLSGDADTIAPDKPNVTVPAPTETQEDTATIQVSGEVGSFVYVNGVKVGVIGADGIAFITLDLEIGDNLFSLILVDSSGNESDAVDFTINGEAVIYTARRVFIFPGNTKRVVVDENVTLSFNGVAPSWVTIDENSLVVSPSESEAFMKKHLVKVDVYRDGTLIEENVLFDILTMKKLILLEGDLGTSGGILYSKWKDVYLKFDPNTLEEDHHFEVYFGLNELGTMILGSTKSPELSENEKLYYNLIMPNKSILYNNYIKDLSEDVESVNQRLNIQASENKDLNEISKATSTITESSTTTTYYNNTFSLDLKKHCVDIERNRLTGFEFNHIWDANWDMFEGIHRYKAGDTRLRNPGEREGDDLVYKCTSRLWGTENPNTIELSENEEPVLLIHGYINTGELGSMRDAKVYFNNFAKVLKSTNKYIPFEFEWRTNARFQDVAKELKKAIELIGKETKKQVHIVAHSFGGVLSRVLIQDVNNKDFSEKYIASLTTVGSPHSGIRDGGYTSTGTYTYNLNGSTTIGNGSITFPHGQHGWQGEIMGGCQAITCYQMGISDRTFNKTGSYYEYGTFKEYGYIPYKLASSIDLYPEVPTQVLIGLNPKSTYPDYIDTNYDLFHLTYEFDYQDSGDELISFEGQRAYPLQEEPYRSSNIEEHILNFHFKSYNDFELYGVGVFDDMIYQLSTLTTEADYQIENGSYDFKLSKIGNDVKITDNKIISDEDNILYSYAKGFTHATDDWDISKVGGLDIRLTSEVGLEGCTSDIFCTNPTWQYFKYHAEQNSAEVIVPQSIAITGDVRVVRTGEAVANMSTTEETSTNPRIIIEVYTADRNILDFILNLVETGERTVLRDDGTYELNVTYAPDTNYTVIAYAEGDEDARIDAHIRAAQSIFLETADTLENSTLHFPTITLVDSTYEEGDLLIKVKESSSGDFLNNFNLSVLLNGLEENAEDIVVSSDIEYRVTKAKGDYTVSVYKDGYENAQVQCFVVADVATECIVDLGIKGAVVHNNTTYGTVTSPYTGKVWLDRNLGASQVCTAYNDAACYGDYYQWGRNYDGHQSSTSATSSTQATDVNSAGSSFIEGSSDWASVDSDGSQRSANWSKTDGTSVCPVGYRVPTVTELKEETLDNGVTNSSTAFSGFLKLPSAGFRYYSNGSVGNVGSWGYVWTGSVDGSYSHDVNFGSDGAYSNYHNRAFGWTVRCLRD